MSEGPDLSDFRGEARLFPLPGFVMFPHVKKMFHIFERRYRQLTVDALGSDQFITQVLLSPGWESDYEGKPKLEPIGCLARIEQHTLFLDGRYNLMVRGLCRVRLEQEQLTSTPYRIARVTALPDALGPEVTGLREELKAAVRNRLGTQSPAWRAMEEQFQPDRSLGMVVDTVSFYLPLRPDLKQELLAELNVEQRGRRLLALIQGDASNFELGVSEEQAQAPRKRIEPSAN